MNHDDQPGAPSSIESVNDEVHEDNLLIDWAKEIKNRAVADIENGQDDGMRDNIMYNDAFARKLVDLCGLLPMWSAMNWRQFKSQHLTSSSAISETYFKNLKQALRDVIPTSLDQFIAAHIRSMIGMTRIAAAKNQSVRIEQTLQPIDQQSASAPVAMTNECPACIRGDAPEGAHTCNICGVAVHALDGCSFALDALDEGYGEKRICFGCHTHPRRGTEDVNCEENWRGLATQSHHRKPSKYMRPAPEWQIIDAERSGKKATISILKNGSINPKSVKMGKDHLSLDCTSSFDSLCQLISVMYIDHEQARSLLESGMPGGVLEIAQLLATR